MSPPSLDKGVRIEALRLWPGAHAGLSEPTATCRWHFPPSIDAAMLPRLRKGVQALWPADPLLPTHDQGWPTGVWAGEPPAESVAAWAVALVVCLQRLVRDPVGGGRVLEQTADHTHVALPYVRPAVLQGAMQFALKLLLAWSGSDSRAEHAVQRALAQWVEKARVGGLSSVGYRFARAAQQLGMPAEIRRGMLHVGWGCNQERLDSTFTGRTSGLATRIARQKHETLGLLHDMGVPVPPSVMAPDEATALQMADRLGWPVVIKPSNMDQGIGVVPDIRDEVLLKSAYAKAATYSPGAVIVEKHIQGDDHRILVVGGRMLMATRRISGGVIGDGRQTVAQLLEGVNTDPRRGDDKRSLLMRLDMDDEALTCLSEQGATTETVPAEGQFLRLRRTANISTGGTAQDVTAQIHPHNRALAERAARLVGLDIAGVDFLCPDISRSWREVGGAICEINAQPGLRPHWLTCPERDINQEMLEWLFHDKPSRIPTAAITGTNGKSTTARMLHHIWQTAGKVTGVCTTNGVWVGQDLVSDQNLSGFPGARMLLADPAVQAAVLEMPRKGLLQFGHACDRYDVAALLNVQDDHIGVDGIHTLEEMAHLKAQVLQRASQAVVVNAQDPLCLAMREHAGCARHILVSSEDRMPVLHAHRVQGGETVMVQMHLGRPWIVLATGATQTPLMPLHEIPATMGGLLKFNASNALFAVAMAWAQGVPLETIRQAMAGFHNSPEQNPGRYNLIDDLPFQLLLDYGHNPDGVRELCTVVQKWPVRGQRHLLTLKIGNRHKAHVDELAPLLCQTFDSFVIGCDAHFVSRSADYPGADAEGQMLQNASQQLVNAGVDPGAVQTERDQATALRMVLRQAQPGDLVVVLAEPWLALPVFKQFRQSIQISAHDGA